ncbi:hypothetical protein LINPERHAP1_LOCUS24904 [Linum perenne]
MELQKRRWKCIRKAHNECVFRGTNSSILLVVGGASSDSNDWGRLFASRPTLLGVPLDHPRRSSRITSQVIQCDGSFSNDSQKAAYNIVITNTLGQVMEGRTETFYFASALVSEALAILEVVTLASQSPLCSTIFIDFKHLVSAICGVPTDTWKVLLCLSLSRVELCLLKATRKLSFSSTIV